MTTMKSLVIAEPKKMIWATRERPAPAAGEALIKIIAAGI
ncbi:MAG TPA: galactonate oxidoreductase, partial [Pantoea sp.]|nr:galactonate oxidoreductase [Pantoea sp.]